MTPEMVREETINMMIGFMKDHLYVGQEISEEELLNTAAIYYDLVNAVEKAVLDREVERASLAAGVSCTSLLEGIVDASSPTQVDLMGGPRAIDKNTMYKG